MGVELGVVVADGLGVFVDDAVAVEVGVLVGVTVSVAVDAGEGASATAAARGFPVDVGIGKGVEVEERVGVAGSVGVAEGVGVFVVAGAGVDVDVSLGASIAALVAVPESGLFVTSASSAGCRVRLSTIALCRGAKVSASRSSTMLPITTSYPSARMEESVMIMRRPSHVAAYRRPAMTLSSAAVNSCSSIGEIAEKGSSVSSKKLARRRVSSLSCRLELRQMKSRAG